MPTKGGRSSNVRHSRRGSLVIRTLDINSPLRFDERPAISRAAQSVTALSKSDPCRICGRNIPQQWMEPVVVRGQALSGTGVWRSSLVDGACETCLTSRQGELQRARQLEGRQEQFIRIVGGTKPYREFTLERYQVTGGNRLAVECAKAFDPRRQDLYLWGPCGVGKTHLAMAILRNWFERGATVVFMTQFQLIRKLRMKPPEEEQQILDRLVQVDLLALDDIGAGGDTPFARQVLQEILDRRHFQDRRGLILTSQHSLPALVRRFNDDAIPSRLAGMCTTVTISGTDRRRCLVRASA